MIYNTLLIADDDPNILKLVKIVLERAGFNVITASDGCEALEKIPSCNPCMIILDIDMPKINGLEVLEQLKNNQSTAKIPVIMLTARTMSNDFNAAMEKKADWYISKPFRNEHLLDKIKFLFKQRYGLDYS